MPQSTPRHSSEQQAAQVLRQFRIVFNAVRSHFNEVEKIVGIGGAQVWALNVIHQKPGIGMNGLAIAMDIHQSTASNLTKQLVKKELIRVQRSETDKRGVSLFVQPKAVQILQEAPLPYEGVLPNALQNLPPETVARLQNDLNQLIAALKADHSAAGIPLGDLCR